MNANNDNQIVDIAKRKLLEIYNDIFYDWKDEFKRTYEKEIFSEVIDCMENINKCFSQTLVDEESYNSSTKQINKFLQEQSNYIF